MRTLKGIVSSHELQLRENGVVLGDDPGTLEFLFRYAAHVHNRFAVSVGSTMSPLQKLRGHDHRPQLTYPFGAVVFAKVSRSSKEEVDAKYARGVYLGPVLGSTGHQVRIRLDSGETKLIVAPGLKLLYPLRYDASLLDGAKALEGFVPPLDEERFRELHLPYVPGGGPSKEWVREHGGTPRCPGCSEEATSSRHSVRCVRRYQRWLRDAVDSALEELDREPPPAQGPPAKRVRFGDSEVREFSAPSAPSEGEVEVPQIDAEANDHLSDYEPSLPSEDEGEDDLMGVAETPKDDRPAIRLLEELWACGCVRYVPTPLTACDVYDLQAFCSLLVDGRSSCDKLPYSCIASLGNVEHEHVEHDVGRLSLGVPVGRSSVDTSFGRSGMSMSVGRSDQSACSGQDQEREGAYMPIGDRWVWVSRPRVSYDDIDGIQLDNKESWEGMKTEVKAVDSLQVGLLRSRSEVDHYQAENPGCRVIKSRWVLTQKAPGLVRARLVAKDFAHGKPSALDLGLSSNTASVEALKLILSRAAKGRMRIWGLDISTAFLFANVVQPTVVELPSSFCLEGGGTAYLILEKALYGLRSASLSWQRHLSKIMVGLGLKASPLEPTLFSGWVQLGQKWTYIIALAYVDDLLIVSDSQEGVEFIHKSLSTVLKVKVTGRLHEDGQLEFLGRLIKLDGNNITLGVKPEYVRSVFSAFGWTEKDLAKIKPVTTTPDIRALYDAEDPESPSPPLSAEAAGRFRSCLGKIGWLTQTRTDITYFHSMLSRGQAAPRMVHEDALRKFLRWFVGCPLLDQIFPAGNGETLEEEGATLVAFCDSNWGSESSTGRKSTSGGVIYVVAGSLWFCVKGYSRLQTVVALSSAEAELFAIAEVAKEIAGLGQLASHIWGELTKPLAIYTDSASARQIAGMEGFLRRMRHVDIRLCFIQAVLSSRPLQEGSPHPLGHPCRDETSELVPPPPEADVSATPAAADFAHRLLDEAAARHLTVEQTRDWRTIATISALHSRMRNHCPVCNLWANDPSRIKVHFKAKHPALKPRLQQAEQIARGVTVRRPCTYCGQDFRGAPIRHSVGCPIIWQSIFASLDSQCNAQDDPLDGGSGRAGVGRLPQVHAGLAGNQAGSTGEPTSNLSRAAGEAPQRRQEQQGLRKGRKRQATSPAGGPSGTGVPQADVHPAHPACDQTRGHDQDTPTRHQLRDVAPDRAPSADPGRPLRRGDEVEGGQGCEATHDLPTPGALDVCLEGVPAEAPARQAHGGDSGEHDQARLSQGRPVALPEVGPGGGQTCAGHDSQRHPPGPGPRASVRSGETVRRPSTHHQVRAHQATSCGTARTLDHLFGLRVESHDPVGSTSCLSDGALRQRLLPSDRNGPEAREAFPLLPSRAAPEASATGCELPRVKTATAEALLSVEPSVTASVAAAPPPPSLRVPYDLILKAKLLNRSNVCYSNATVLCLLWACNFCQQDLLPRALHASLEALLKKGKPVQLWDILPYKQLLSNWPRPGQQHCAAEFLKHYQASADMSGLNGIWQARTLAGEVRYMGDTCPLPVSVPLTAGDTLQDIIDRWAAQSEVHALWYPADCIALQLSRYSNGKLLTPVTLAPHRNVHIPNYVAADCHVQKVAYVLRCAVVHLGATPAEGHYRAAFFEDDRVLYANDNKAAVTANAHHIAEISTNCYVLYLTREEMFDPRRAAL